MESITYDISNGVKQGGVLSPVLFNVYVDNLIRILRDTIGCMYNNEYMGSLISNCYALPFTAYTKMLQICVFLNL